MKSLANFQIEQITEGKPGLLRVTAKQGDTEIVEEYNTVRPTNKLLIKDFIPDLFCFYF